MQAQAITDPCFSSGNFCEGRRFLSPTKLEGWGLMVAEQVGYIADTPGASHIYTHIYTASYEHTGQPHKSTHG